MRRMNRLWCCPDEQDPGPLLVGDRANDEWKVMGLAPLEMHGLES
jgi:hypothetical protein